MNLGFFYNCALLRHVDSVQELTNVLLLDQRGLVDEGGGPGHGLDVVAFQDQLVLLRRGILAAHSGLHVHSPQDLLTEEITDLDQPAVVGGGDVDGEVSVDGPHLVLVAGRHALDHVLDVGADRADGGQLFSDPEPFHDDQLVFSLLLHVDLHVAKVPAEDSSRATDGHLAGIHFQEDVFRDFHRLRRVDDLHFLIWVVFLIQKQF